MIALAIAPFPLMTGEVKGKAHCELGLGPSSPVWQMVFFRVPQPATFKK